MTHFVTGLLTFCSQKGPDDPVSQNTYLVLNLPGQPFTLFDEQKSVTLQKRVDIYDRLILKSLTSIEDEPGKTPISILAFGVGALTAVQLVLSFGDGELPITNFFAFNGVFRVDDRIRRSFGDLACSLQEANESAHAKLLDITNNCKLWLLDWIEGVDELSSSGLMSDEFDRNSTLYCLSSIDSSVDLKLLWPHFKVLFS